MDSLHQEQFDLIGCGFGPANLALSVAIVEGWLKQGRESSPLKRVCFVEKHPDFQWHPGMLLPNTIMQISCLKDLATLRNPTSPFTFLSYLHEHNRLVSFINRGSVIPTRREYADYLKWAANKVKSAGIEIFYGEEVSSLEVSDQKVHCLSQKNGELITRVASNITIAPGGLPRIPSTFASLPPSPVVFHTSSYAQSIDIALKAARGNSNKALRICVIGSGQSAAEAFLDVRSRLCDLPPVTPDWEPLVRHEIDLIIRRGSLKPSDDSPFSNEVFDPESTDEIFNLPTEKSRKRLLAEYRGTNYSVVNPKTLETLYEHIYNQKVEEGARDRSAGRDNSIKAQPPLLRILNNQSVIDVSSATLAEGSPPAITLALQHMLTRQLSESCVYDILILATGYERKTHVRLLESKSIAETFGLDSGVSRRNDALSPREIPGVFQGLLGQEVSALQVTDALDSSSTPSVTSSGTSLGTSLGTSSATSSDGPQSKPLISRLNVTRNYRLISEAAAASPRIYLQGCSEATHGISETLLSVVSVRAGEILGDILEGYSE